MISRNSCIGALAFVYGLNQACSTDDASPPAKETNRIDGSVNADDASVVTPDATPQDAYVDPAKIPDAPFVAIDVVVAGPRVSVTAYDPFYSSPQCATKRVEHCLVRSCSNLLSAPDGGYALPPFAKGSITLTNGRTGQVVVLKTNSPSASEGTVVYADAPVFPTQAGDPIRIQWGDNDKLPVINWEAPLPPSIAFVTGAYSPAAGAPLAWVAGDGDVRMRIVGYGASLFPPYSEVLSGSATCFFDRRLGQAQFPKDVGAPLQLCGPADAGKPRFTGYFASGGAETSVVAGPPTKVFLSLSATGTMSRSLECSQ